MPEDASRLLDAAFEAHLRGKPVRAVKNLVWALDLDNTLRNDPAAQTLAEAYTRLPAHEAFDVLADKTQRQLLLAAIEEHYAKKKPALMPEHPPPTTVLGCPLTVTGCGCGAWFALLILAPVMLFLPDKQMVKCEQFGGDIGWCMPSLSWYVSRCILIAALVILTIFLAVHYFKKFNAKRIH